MPMSGTPQIGDWLDASLSTTWTSQGWVSNNRSALTQKMVLHPDGVLLYVPGDAHYLYMKANGDTTWTKATTSLYTGLGVHGIMVYDPEAEVLWWVCGNTTNSFVIRAFTVSFSTYNITLVDTHTVSQTDGTVWPEVAFAWQHTGSSAAWLTVAGDHGTTDGPWARSYALSGGTISNQGSDTTITEFTNWDGQNAMYGFINTATYGDGRQHSYYLGNQVDNETNAYMLWQVVSAGFSTSTLDGGYFVFNTNRVEESDVWLSALTNWRTSAVHDIYSQPAIWRTAGGAGRVLFYDSMENEFRLAVRADLVNDSDVWSETSQGKPTGFAPASAGDVNACHLVYNPIDDKVHASVVEYNGATYDLHFFDWTESGGWENVQIDVVAGATTVAFPVTTDNTMAVRTYVCGALIGVFDETSGRGYMSFIYFEGDGSGYGPVEYNIYDTLGVGGGAPSAWGVWGT